MPAVTGLINRLFKMKMVKRLHATADRRVIYISLTSLGKKTLERIKESRRRVFEELFTDLSDEERSTYLAIVRKVKGIIYERSQNLKK